MKHILIGLLLVFSLFGCGSGKAGGHIPLIDLEDAFDNNSEYVNLSRYCKSIEYIPLETNYESVLDIDGVTKVDIRADSNSVFIKNSQTNAIVVFSNKTGEYITSFNRLGRGPGEYQDFYFWDLKGESDSDNFRLAIHCMNSAFIYGKGYDFLHKIDADYGDIWSSPNVFKVILAPNEKCDYIYTLDCERNFNLQSGRTEVYNYLVKRDSTGETVSRLIDKRVHPWQWPMTEFFTYGKTLKYLTSGRDSIFAVKDIGNISLEYTISLGRYEYLRAIVPSVEKKGTVYYEPAEKSINENKYFIALTGYLPPSDLPQIYLQRGYNQRCPSFILYDKKEQKTFALKRLPEYDFIGMVDDLEGGMPFAPVYMRFNKMYQLVDAIDFIEYAQKSNSQKMKQVAATLTEESNPVMVVATLKQ